jgi:hypothetical protein
MKTSESLLRNIIRQELKNEMATRGPLTPEQKAQRAANKLRREEEMNAWRAESDARQAALDAVPMEKRRYGYGNEEITYEEYINHLRNGDPYAFRDDTGKRFTR